MRQEHILQIQIMEQEANQLNQQLQLIEQNLSEMQDLRDSLEEIKENNNGEILANLGKKIYLPVKITDKKLIVEVGKGHLVKKTIPETQEVIDNQLKKLISAQIEIKGRLEQLQEQLEAIVEEIQKEQEKEKRKKKD